MTRALIFAASLALAGVGFTLIRSQLAPLLGAYTATIRVALQEESRR